MRALLDRAAGVALALALAVAVVVAGLAVAGVRPHVEASASMAPLLQAGDVLWLDEVAARDARVGDVVAFRRDGRVLLHRVRRITPAAHGRLAVTTRGDAATGTETWTVARSASLGRYTGLRLPAVGRLTGAALGAPAAPLLAALAALLLASVSLRAIWVPATS